MTQNSLKKEFVYPLDDLAPLSIVPTSIHSF